ncbi:MAG: hypothetical protein HDT16_10090 [Oscillibacter sp.]|nr:hypothetical protein [Oscillibacter sp.]
MSQSNQSKLQQALGDKKMMEQIVNSPDAKKLANMLAQGTNEASLQKIAASAAKGDTTQLKALIQSITSTPGGAELLQRLGNSFGQK